MDSPIKRLSELVDEYTSLETVLYETYSGYQRNQNDFTRTRVCTAYTEVIGILCEIQSVIDEILPFEPSKYAFWDRCAEADVWEMQGELLELADKLLAQSACK